jgi:ABC-type sugar transport system substrate-binding protein
MAHSRDLMRRMLLPFALGALLLSACSSGDKATGTNGMPARLRIGLVAKSLGNGFFDAVKKGRRRTRQR